MRKAQRQHTLAERKALTAMEVFVGESERRACQSPSSALWVNRVSTTLY